MKKINLTQGQFAIVDDEDFEWLSYYSWSARWNPRSHTYYALSNEIGLDEKFHTIYMHRKIMNTSRGEVVDHINHNGLDNRKSNLRNVRNLENSQNRRGHNSNSRSGYLGVSPDGGRWKAQIQVDGKKLNLGRYSNVEDAIHARQEAELRYFIERNK